MDDQYREFLSQYLAGGLCALPAKLTEKRPSITTWKQYQKKLPSLHHLEKKSLPGSDAVCIVTGRVSGNLEILDFDYGGELFTRWTESIPRDLFNKLVIQTTQSGGCHAIYRCEQSVSGNLKLAQVMKSEGLVTLIETRGEGGLFLCDPSPGYEVTQGSLLNLPVLTEQERELLLSAAWQLNTYWPQVAEAAPESERASSLRPGDDYSTRGDVVALLRSHGWKPAGTRQDGNQHWTRPGKTRGTSATLKDRTFYVFTSSAGKLEPNQAYSPFALYTILEHEGDYERAARALKKQGFGEAKHRHQEVDLSALINSDLEEDTSANNQAVDPGHIPLELLRVPGFISEVMDYCIEHAPTRNPAMAFCGALALQSFLGGRKVRDSADNRTNLYLLALAPTGSGKDYPRKINKLVLTHIGMGHASVLRFASGEAIEDKLAHTPNLLCQTDEIDGMLLQIKGARDARHDSLMDRLKEIYTSADQSITTRCLAKTQSVEVHQPSLTLLGTAVPNHYYAALSEKMLTDGFFSRTLCVEATESIEDQDPQIITLPQRVLETATWWSQYSPTPGNLANQNPTPAIVPMTSEARDLLREVRRLAREKQNEANRGGLTVDAAIWSRVRQMTHKLALIYAISQNHLDPEITAKGVNWAREFTLHQARRMLFMASCHVTTGDFDADCKKAIRILTDWRNKHGENAGIAPWRFRQRMNLHPQRFKDVIFELEQREQVHLFSVPGRTKPFLGYKLK